MNKEESHRPTRRSERILQLYEKKKRKLEAFSPKEGNGTCQKRMRYNQQSGELRSNSVLKKDRQGRSGGARQNVTHSKGTRLQAKRKREFEFSHEENYRFGKKRKISEFSNEENDGLKMMRKHVEIFDKAVGYMPGDKTETDINERKRKRKSCVLLNKVDVQLKEKKNCKANNQASNFKNPQVRYSMKENQSLTAANDKTGFKENENLAKASVFDDKYANESIQWMAMANNALETSMEEYMHQIRNETYGEDQNVVNRNEFQNQILEVFGNNLYNSYYFLELIRNQEDINNNKQTLQQKYELQLPNKHSCIEKSDINMNETVLVSQRLDGIDITHIGLCNESYAATDSDLYQDQCCVYPSIKDLKIEVGHYEDSDYPSLANPTTMGSYIESIDTITSVTCTKVTVKQELIWDDYEKGTDCIEDNDNENDSEDTDMPSSTLSELRIRPLERRKRVLVPLRIRLLKTLTMRKAWKENTTCCLKYCWIDWPTVTMGQI